MVDKAMAVRRQSAARRDCKVREFGDGGSGALKSRFGTAQGKVRDFAV